jgi:hypothetical protein
MPTPSPSPLHGAYPPLSYRRSSASICGCTAVAAVFHASVRRSVKSPRSAAKRPSFARLPFPCNPLSFRIAHAIVLSSFAVAPYATHIFFVHPLDISDLHVIILLVFRAIPRPRIATQTHRPRRRLRRPHISLAYAEGPELVEGFVAPSARRYRCRTDAPCAQIAPRITSQIGTTRYAKLASF